MQGAIFDLDGTLVDNMPVHADAFAIFVQRHGLPSLTMADRRRLDGRRNRDIFPDLFGRPLSDDEQRAFAGEKEALYRELSAGRLVPVTGLLDLLDRLDARDIPVAVATSAPPENVHHSLAELGLAARLTRIVRSDQVPRGKPFPDVFLAAADRLGVQASECVAFEDAPIGIMAARAAGMRSVALTTSFGRDVFLDPAVGADEVVSDFAQYLTAHPEL
jgi:HAD superfamily hydrolase (TIGR01509 family)